MCLEVEKNMAVFERFSAHGWLTRHCHKPDGSGCGFFPVITGAPFNLITCKFLPLKLGFSFAVSLVRSVSANGGYSYLIRRSSCGSHGIESVLQDLAKYEAHESARISAEPLLTEVQSDGNPTISLQIEIII